MKRAAVLGSASFESAGGIKYYCMYHSLAAGIRSSAGSDTSASGGIVECNELPAIIRARTREENTKKMEEKMERSAR